MARSSSPARAVAGSVCGGSGDGQGDRGDGELLERVREHLDADPRPGGYGDVAGVQLERSGEVVGEVAARGRRVAREQEVRQRREREVRGPADAALEHPA